MKTSETTQMECEIGPCTERRACGHYCTKHHQDVCMDLKSPTQIAKDMKKRSYAHTAQIHGSLPYTIFQHGVSFLFQKLNEPLACVGDSDLHEIMNACRSTERRIREELQARGLPITPIEEIVPKCLSCSQPIENEADLTGGLCFKCEGGFEDVRAGEEPAFPNQLKEGLLTVHSRELRKGDVLIEPGGERSDSAFVLGRKERTPGGYWDIETASAAGKLTFNAAPLATWKIFRTK